MAAAAGLTGSPLAFTARGTVGAPAQFVKVSGDAQHSLNGSTLSLPVIVQVQDANGNGAAGVAVTFTVMSGGGTMAGITSLTTLTDENGNAAVGWTVGSVTGLTTLRATALGLSGSPVGFTASGYTPLYVANIDGNNSLAVFEAELNGNVPPVRIISGLNTGLKTPTGISLGASGELYVSNYTGQSITIFDPGAAGNVAPVRTISGVSTGINGPYALTQDVSGQIYVSNFTNNSVTV